VHLRAYVCSVRTVVLHVCVRTYFVQYMYLHVILCRFSAKQALRHPYFAELREAEIRALKARHEQSVSGASSLRGTAMAASTAGRQQHFGRVGLHRIMRTLTPANDAVHSSCTLVSLLFHSSLQRQFHRANLSMVRVYVIKSVHSFTVSANTVLCVYPCACKLECTIAVVQCSIKQYECESYHYMPKYGHTYVCTYIRMYVHVVFTLKCVCCGSGMHNRTSGPHCCSQILPQVQEGSHGERQQPASPAEVERLRGEDKLASPKQVTLPELVAKSPPPWPGLVEKKQPESFYKNVSSGKTLPGVLHHQKKRQVSPLWTIPGLCALPACIRTFFHVCQVLVCYILPQCLPSVCV